MKDGRVAVTPRLTTVDVGMRFEFTGRIAADGQTVTTRFRYVDTRVGDTVMGVPLTVPQDGADGLRRLGVVVIEAPDVDTQTVEATVELRPGRSVVIPGPVRMQEVRERIETPVLSSIPYVSLLFTTVGVTRVPVRTYLVLSAVVIEDGDGPAPPVAPAPRPAGR
jgi:type II secretory pathway component GspD/PulD (secretin)